MGFRESGGKVEMIFNISKYADSEPLPRISTTVWLPVICNKKATPKIGMALDIYSSVSGAKVLNRRRFARLSGLSLEISPTVINI